MTPFAAVVLACFAAPPAGAGMPVSGFAGTAGKAVSSAAGPRAGTSPRPARPRADAFVPGTALSELQPLRRVRPPFAASSAAAAPDTLEVVFFAAARPVRARVTVTVNGRPLAETWTAHLRGLFAGFDRDRDGFLNRLEADNIFSAKGLSSLLGGSYYYRTPVGAPTFEDLDRDDDGRVSFPEFAAYAGEAVADLLTPRFVPVAAPNAARLTHELFAKLDRNKDGKLSRAEVRDAETILVTSDADDDECLSPLEIFPDLFDAPTPPVGGMPTPPPAATSSPDLGVYRTALPGAVTQQLIKRYDADGDFLLSAAEIGLDPAAFALFDTDKNGKLSAAELEAWRTGPPDLLVTLDLARAASECRCVVTPGRGTAFPPGFELRPGGPGRTAVRVGKQFLDLVANPPPAGAQKSEAARMLANTFPQGKDAVTEDDIGGPQFQFLRIVFDAADANMDGKLTRKEFAAYLELQQTTIDLALSVTYATRTPSLFQLLDENGDGRLGVRELRTAFDRLILLEPAGGEFVTKAAILPSAGLRVGRTAYLAADPAQLGNPFERTRVPNTRGPVWFKKMDRNGDGDVSRAEFLGTREDFDRIDADRDGLISAAEAEAFDAATRPAAVPAAKK